MADVVVPRLNTNDRTYVLLDWLVDDGAVIRRGDAVVVLETSKTAEELVCEGAGVLHHVVAVGGECRPGEVIGRVFAAESERQRFLAAAPPSGAAAAAGQDGVVLTGPARALIEELGIPLERVRALGRSVVRREDVEQLATPVGPAPAPTDAVPGRVHLLPRSQQGVAAVVTESHRTVPAAFTAVSVDVEQATDLARRLSRSTRCLVGLPELLVKALAGLRERFPLFFGTNYDGRSVRLVDGAHVGVTVDVGTGLFIPVVRDAQEMACTQLADVLMDFRERATSRTFRTADLTGATIVVSLQGEADVTVAVPLVPPDLVCAVSLGGVRRELILDDRGEVVPRQVTTIGVAYDHRVVNGRDALLFLRETKAALEAPTTLAGVR
ncbi:MAG: 2-oxo acid dehydrogenase subunit E2 [Actinobacteria bacterium]|nr:2-oxo acid dehydrogenase subunit E2 [Actinomycetota bacterium]